MNKSKIIHLAAYSLSFLLLAYVIFRLFSLGADLGLKQAELRDQSNKLGNLLKIDIPSISSLQISSNFGNVFLLNVQEKIEDWEKKEYRIHLNREIRQALDDITVTSHGIKWQLLEPSVAKVDQAKVHELLDTVAKLPFYSVHVSSSEEQIKQFGLHNPKIILKCVFNNRQETEMHVGIACKDDPNRFYLRFKDSTVVYKVGPEIRKFLIKKLSFVDREIGAKRFCSIIDFFSFFRASDSFYLDACVSSKTLFYCDNNPFSLAYNNDNVRWYSYRPFYNILNQTIAHEISKIFSDLRATDCIDEFSTKSAIYTSQMEKYGFYQPNFHLRMGEMSGKNWDILVGKRLGDFYYVRISNRPYVYLVEQHFFNSLLLPNYQYMRSQPFSFSLDSLVKFEYTDKASRIQLDFDKKSSNYANNPVYGCFLQDSFNFSKLTKLSVAPDLPVNNEQYIIAEYQQRVYMNELAKGNKSVIWPSQFQVTYEIFDADKAKSTVLDTQIFNIKTSSKVGKESQNLFNELFKAISSAHASDLAWQTIFLDKSSAPNYDFKFIFKNGQVLRFSLYEATYNSYYLYINDSFSHYVIQRDLLIGSTRTNRLTELINKIISRLKTYRQS